MAAVVEPLLMTVEEYRELPQRSDVVQELHWGQVVTLTRPKMRHTKLQVRLVDLLRSRVGEKGAVASEVPFRALPQYELRGADGPDDSAFAVWCRVERCGDICVDPFLLRTSLEGSGHVVLTVSLDS